MRLQKLLFLVLSCFASMEAHAAVDPTHLNKEVGKRLGKVSEFEFILKEANKLGVKVYLFGGTAAAFAHYVRWDLEREAGDKKYQSEKFDYDFTNIYRGNQDLDIVVDGTLKQAEELKKILLAKYPHLVGERSAWEVRLLRERYVDKRALLNDDDFKNQHTDTNSTGLIALNPKEKENTFYDLLDWKNLESQFLKDVSEGKISYLFGAKHETTERYKSGLNPPILSAIRYLAKLTQYEVQGSDQDLKTITKIITETDFQDLSDYAKHKVTEFSLKALLNAPDVEMAWNLLESTGLREKLILMDGGEKQFKKEGSLAWWMNKEPLRSFELGQGEGLRAQDIFEQEEIIVSHETSNFQAYENISRSVQGRANVFVSRTGIKGENAALGEGFYAKVGVEGAIGNGITLRFRLHPEAREGKDFSYYKKFKFVVVHNKNALELIQENINIGLVELFELVAQNDFTDQNKGFLEKVKRKLKRQKLEKAELDQIVKVLESLEGKSSKNESIYSIWVTFDEAQHYPHIIDKIMKHYGRSHFVAKDLMAHDWAHKIKWVNQTGGVSSHELMVNQVFEKTFQEKNIPPNVGFTSGYLGIRKFPYRLRQKIADELFEFDTKKLQQSILPDYGWFTYDSLLRMLVKMNTLANQELNFFEKQILYLSMEKDLKDIYRSLEGVREGLHVVRPQKDHYEKLAEVIAIYMQNTPSVEDDKGFVQALENVIKGYDQSKYFVFASIFTAILMTTAVFTLPMFDHVEVGSMVRTFAGFSGAFLAGNIWFAIPKLFQKSVHLKALKSIKNKLFNEGSPLACSALL